MPKSRLIEVTGFDSVIFTCASSDRIITRVYQAIVDRWHNTTVEVERMEAEAHLSGPMSVAELVAAACDERHTIYWFYRDAEMKLKHESHGYFLDEFGEGPLELHLRKRSTLVLELFGVTEQSYEEKGIGVLPPYPAWLCTPSILEMTIVTPGNPQQEPFSNWAFTQAMSACT